MVKFRNILLIAAALPTLVFATPKLKVVLLTPEQQVLQSPSFEGEDLTAKLEEVYKEKFLSVKNEEVELYYPEYVAPYEMFEASANWLLEAGSLSESPFGMQSEAGRRLYRYFAAMMLGGHPEGNENFMSVGSQVYVKFSGTPVGAQMIPAPNEKPIELEAIVRKPMKDIPNPEEHIKQCVRARELFPTFPDEKIKTTYVVNTNSKDPLKIGVVMTKVGELLTELGERVEKALTKYQSALRRASEAMAEKAYGEKIPFGPTNFSNLPESMKAYITDLANANPARFGFQSAAQAQSYFGSNPKLEIIPSLELKMITKTSSDAKPTLLQISLKGIQGNHN
jgi:hypothetical protein